MIVGFTGHRPDKLGGYTLPNEKYISVCKKIDTALEELKPTRAISGMALGIDQWAAHICIKKGIPFTAAIPFGEQDKIWPADAKKIYRILLGKAESYCIVSEGGYSAHKLQIRNEWIVDNCDILIACWDGTKGGTAKCVAYAEKVNKKIYRIEP